LDNTERDFGRVGDEIDFHGDRRRETGKIIVVREEPINRGDGKPSLRCFIPVADVPLLVRDDLDACLAVRETDKGNGASLMHNRLCALFVCQAVRDSDMTVTFSIDARHLTAEESAMDGCVLELVDGDVVMNHLMEDGVLNEFFRQVDARVDAENEVFVFITAKEALLAAGKGHLAEKTLGVAEFDGDKRKGTAEEAGVVLVKTGLDIIN